MPYRIRHGSVGVIGVGGGRDVLTAIEAGNTRITGIEINKALVHALQGPYRDFARVADHPGVTLVHDEARSFLTRAPGQIRRAADVAHRYLGGDRRWRIHAVRERPLHPRGMAGVSRAP